MPRRSAFSDQLASKTRRNRLAIRPKPYTEPVREGVLLAYLKTGAGAGRWAVLTRAGSDEQGRAKYVRRVLADADDLSPADGSNVLAYDQAVRAAGERFERAGPITVRQAAAAYLKHMRAAKGERAESDARQKIESRILPALGEVKIADLTKTRVETWHASLVPESADADAERRARDTANRHLSALKAVLNHAFSDEANAIVSDTAWRRVKPFRKVGRAREDHFTAAQVRALIAATDDERFADLVAALFLTGARYGDLAACDVRHLDGDVLTIPSGKTGGRIVQLNDEAARLLARVAGKRAPGEPLFTRNEAGERWGTSHQHRPMKKALKAAGLPASASVYTMRHSHISRSIEAGVPVTIIAENCGTSVRMIEVNYAKALANARRKLLAKAGPALRLAA